MDKKRKCRECGTTKCDRLQKRSLCCSCYNITKHSDFKDIKECGYCQARTEYRRRPIPAARHEAQRKWLFGTPEEKKEAGDYYLQEDIADSLEREKLGIGC